MTRRFCSFANFVSDLRNLVVDHVIAHLSNYRPSATFFGAEFERHSSTRRRRPDVARRETAGEWWYHYVLCGRAFDGLERVDESPPCRRF